MTGKPERFLRVLAHSETLGTDTCLDDFGVNRGLREILWAAETLSNCARDTRRLWSSGDSNAVSAPFQKQALPRTLR
jgi:hypothetical protein